MGRLLPDHLQNKRPATAAQSVAEPPAAAAAQSVAEPPAPGLRQVLEIACGDALISEPWGSVGGLSLTASKCGCEIAVIAKVVVVPLSNLPRS